MVDVVVVVVVVIVVVDVVDVVVVYEYDSLLLELVCDVARLVWFFV